jgi:CheY-like chemotaxis protein
MEIKMAGIGFPNTILLADDDSWVLEMAKTLLEESGFSEENGYYINCVQSGAEVEAELLNEEARKKYLFVILDNQMFAQEGDEEPSDDVGLRVALRVRAEGVKIPIYMCSSDPAAKFRKEGLEVLPKPFGPKIQELVQKYLNF